MSYNPYGNQSYNPHGNYGQQQSNYRPQGPGNYGQQQGNYRPQGPGNYGQQQGNYGQQGGSYRPPGHHGYQQPYQQGHSQQGYHANQNMGGYGAPRSQVPPGIDPSVHAWFIAVDEDRSGKITSAELRQALINNKMQQFNEETCRLMIGMFDKNQDGS